jgi:hypothetical protein
VAKFQDAKAQQELFKSRTFDDLARSGTLATAGAEKGKKQEKFSLDSYIQNAGFADTNFRNDLEKAKQQEIGSKTQSFALDAYNSYIRNITNPAQRLAAAQQYGSSF